MFFRQQDDKIWLSPAATVQSLNRFLILRNFWDLLSFQIKLHKSGAQELFSSHTYCKN